MRQTERKRTCLNENPVQEEGPSSTILVALQPQLGARTTVQRVARLNCGPVDDVTGLLQ
jgi:hypothetical protein